MGLLYLNASSQRELELRDLMLDTEGSKRVPLEDSVESIKDVPSIAEFILNKAMSFYLREGAFVPSLNSRMGGKPDVLRSFHLMHGSAGSCRYGGRRSSIVGGMAESLGKLPHHLTPVNMLSVARM